MIPNFLNGRNSKKRIQFISGDEGVSDASTSSSKWESNSDGSDSSICVSDNLKLENKKFHVIKEISDVKDYDKREFNRHGIFQIFHKKVFEKKYLNFVYGKSYNSFGFVLFLGGALLMAFSVLTDKRLFARCVAGLYVWNYLILSVMHITPCIMNTSNGKIFLEIMHVFHMLCMNIGNVISTFDNTHPKILIFHPFLVNVWVMNIAFLLCRVRIVVQIIFYIIDFSVITIEILILSIVWKQYNVWFIYVMIIHFYIVCSVLFLFSYVSEIGSRRQFVSKIIIARKKQEILRQSKICNKLLKNIFPKAHIQTIKNSTDDVFFINKYENSGVLFLDLVQFTKFSNENTSETIILFLNTLFLYYDKFLISLRLEKIYTLGDGYFAATFGKKCCVENLLLFAISVQKLRREQKSIRGCNYNFRIGIDFGTLYTVCYGNKKKHLTFDIFGEIVKNSMELEEKCLPNSICVSHNVHNDLGGTFMFEKYVNQKSDDKKEQCDIYILKFDTKNNEKEYSCIKNMSKDTNVKLKRVFKTYQKIKLKLEKDDLKRKRMVSMMKERQNNTITHINEVIIDEPDSPIDDDDEPKKLIDMIPIIEDPEDDEPAIMTVGSFKIPIFVRLLQFIHTFISFNDEWRFIWHVDSYYKSHYFVVIAQFLYGMMQVLFLSSVGIEYLYNNIFICIIYGMIIFNFFALLFIPIFQTYDILKTKGEKYIFSSLICIICVCFCWMLLITVLLFPFQFGLYLYIEIFSFSFITIFLIFQFHFFIKMFFASIAFIIAGLIFIIHYESIFITHKEVLNVIGSWLGCYLIVCTAMSFVEYFRKREFKDWEKKNQSHHEANNEKEINERLVLSFLPKNILDMLLIKNGIDSINSSSGKHNSNKDTKLRVNRMSGCIAFIAIENVEEYFNNNIEESVKYISDLFNEFWECVEIYNCVRIKSFGYKLIYNSPFESEKKECILKCIQCALLCLEKFIATTKKYSDNNIVFKCGISFGDYSAGIVGYGKYLWDIYGLTICIASRLCENNQKINSICTNNVVYEIVKKNNDAKEQEGSVVVHDDDMEYEGMERMHDHGDKLVFEKSEKEVFLKGIGNTFLYTIKEKRIFEHDNRILKE